MILLAFLCDMFFLNAAARESNHITISEPKPGSIIADILTVEMSAPKQYSHYSLRIIAASGYAESLELVSDGALWYSNIDTKKFPNGNYYLYIVGKANDTIVIDSDITQIVIDNTQSSIKSDIVPSYISSGNMIKLSLFADLDLLEANAELENGIRLSLSFNSDTNAWEEYYFVPFTYLDKTYVVNFDAKDIHHKSISCPSSSFTICNTEPVIEYPNNRSQFVNPYTKISGYFKPGESIFIFRKKKDASLPGEGIYELLHSVNTDTNGTWMVDKVTLSSGINEFLVSSRQTEYEKVLYPRQKTSIFYYPNGLIVLNYHDIQPKSGTYAKSNESFRQDLEFIKKNGFNPVSPTVFLNYLDGKAELPEKPVLITFDDGLKGLYQYAFPLLKEYGYQAILFIIVSRIGNNPDYLTWKEIYEMQSSRVFSIESHTFNSHFFVDDENGRHAALVSYLTLPDGTIESNEQYKKRVLDDIIKSKEIIETKLDKKVHFVSIPFGIGNQSLNILLKEAGFKGSFTSGGGVNSYPLSPWDIKRFTILNTDELQELVH